MNDDAQRREIILAAALRLLRHYGPHKTTVADVAREAGVGVGTVYLEFPSKDALVEELSRARGRAILAAMRAAAEAPRKTFRARLSGAFDARLQAYVAIAAEGTHACDLVHCPSSAGAVGAPVIPGVKTALSRFWEEELGLVADLLHAGVAAGELCAPDPRASARALLHAYAGFAPPWVHQRPREELLAGIAVMHEIVLYGVVRRPGGSGRRRASPRAGGVR
jgi:AcrR family transcriptional regulator